jgi:hypothetical protein
MALIKVSELTSTGSVKIDDILMISSTSGSGYTSNRISIEDLVSSQPFLDLGSSGTAGSSGTSGSNGSSGTSGSNGSSGSDGSSGTSGSSGSSGTSGSNGTNGSSGSSGSSGSNGTDGTSGSNGTNGSSGSSGSNGTNGSSGSNGTDGSSGSSGSSGSNGTNGSSGSSGSNGTDGSSGTSGTSGTSGLVTLTGSTAGGLITYDGSGTNATVQSGLTYSGTTLTAPTGSFDNVIVNGQPTTYGVANLTTGVVAIQSTATGTMNATVGKVTLSNSYSQVVGASSPGTTIFTLPTLQPGTYLITAQAKVNGGYSAMGIFTGGSQVANTSVFNWYQPSGTVNNGLQGTWVLTVTTPTVYTINAWGGGTVSAGSDGTAVANYIQINPTFALTAISGLTTTSDVNVGGNLNVTGTGGNVLTKTTGTWTVPTGASTQSFTVDMNSSYSMWVNGNIPNGIISWNATATLSNSNVPAVGAQYGWYYTPGNALVLTAMPDQFVGTNGSISNTPTSYAPNTSNVFSFGITNNSGTSQTINYGYIKLS